MAKPDLLEKNYNPDNFSPWRPPLNKKTDLLYYLLWQMPPKRSKKHQEIKNIVREIVVFTIYHKFFTFLVHSGHEALRNFYRMIRGWQGKSGLLPTELPQPTNGTHNYWLGSTQMRKSNFSPTTYCSWAKLTSLVERLLPKKYSWIAEKKLTTPVRTASTNNLHTNGSAVKKMRNCNFPPTTYHLAPTTDYAPPWTMRHEPYSIKL